jgi:hypothetical protein
MVNLRDKSGRSLYFSNRPEYYRRKRISEGVKKSYARRKIIKAQFQKRRIRQQVTIDFRDKNRPPYYVSLRIVTINNPSITEKKLLEIAEEFKRSDEELKGMKENYKGYEKQEIDDYEEQEINDKEIYVQIEYISGMITTTKWF